LTLKQLEGLALANPENMLWTYERTNHTLLVETRIDNTCKEYVLIIRADGTEQIEHFADAVSFQMRIVAIERQLQKEQWHTHNGVALRDAWKL
jgi:hypothetical protein